MGNIVNVSLKHESDFRFSIRFGPDVPVVYGDAPPPLGNATGPSPTQLLGAAVGNCLSASLLFALRKFKQQPGPIAAEVAVTVDRNAENHLRVARIAVRIAIGVAAASIEHLDRASTQFEEFCTFTQSMQWVGWAPYSMVQWVKEPPTQELDLHS